MQPKWRNLQIEDYPWSGMKWQVTAEDNDDPRPNTKVMGLFTNRDAADRFVEQMKREVGGTALVKYCDSLHSDAFDRLEIKIGLGGDTYILVRNDYGDEQDVEATYGMDIEEAEEYFTDVLAMIQRWRKANE